MPSVYCFRTGRKSPMSAKHVAQESGLAMDCPGCQKRHRNWAPGVLYPRPGRDGGPGELRWRPWDLGLPPSQRHSRPRVETDAPDPLVEACACRHCGFVVLQLCATDEAQLRGAMVRRAREDKGLTQKELARRTDAGSQTRISMFENGRADLSRSELRRVAEALNMPLPLWRTRSAPSERCGSRRLAVGGSRPIDRRSSQGGSREVGATASGDWA
jgi:transcriptional regulator with XRE-family HTH domain